MKISELIRTRTTAYALAAAVAAFTLPALAHATSEEGGAGATSGSSSSESGYTVDDSTGMSHDPADTGGAGSTSGEMSTEPAGAGSTDETGIPTASPSPSPDAGGAGSTSGSSSDSGRSDSMSTDEGGAGTTSSGSMESSGSTLANEIKGVIDSVDTVRRSVTIRDSQGNLTSYTLEKGGNVKVGERNASMAALTNGAPVTVTVSESDPTAAKSIKVGS